MVGIFSRFSAKGINHRRAQRSIDETEVLPPNSEATNTNTVAAVGGGSSHGIETTVEFKPVEHPIEPLDYDQPIQCPLPEPSILNDGRIWKERVSSGVQRRVPDMPDPITQDHSPVEPETPRARPETPRAKPETPRARPRPPNRGILPSASAPEHNILKLLDECNASGISFHT